MFQMGMTILFFRMIRAIIIIFLSLNALFSFSSDRPQYTANPFSFVVEEPVYGDGTSFFVADLNRDGLFDFTYRSKTKLYVYDHGGSLLWKRAIAYSCADMNHHGAKHGAADVDGDGDVEIVALDDSNRVVVFDGANGAIEDTLTVAERPNQIAGHVAVVNLRGEGDRDVIVQTVDIHPDSVRNVYYINRSLMAYRLDTKQMLWRVDQDDDPQPEIYERYWGQAHGPFFCADVDGDGLDEVIGGNMIDDDGTVMELNYPIDWLDATPRYIDHFDCIAVGDFRPDLPGLEWIVTEEDLGGDRKDWNTTMLRFDPGFPNDGILWRRETDLFPEDRSREPQNVAAGNFDLSRNHGEVWVRSAFCDDSTPSVSQHPWIFDGFGRQFAHYATEDSLPAGFNAHPDGNKRGLEMIWTVDWSGEKKELIAAKARHISGNIGVFDPLTGKAVWNTPDDFPAVEASFIYVADVAGDTREEIIVYDELDGTIKVYWNEEANPNQPKPDKWDDSLYRRLKQNWNYYSPGGYTSGSYPLVSNLNVSQVTTNSAVVAWDTDEAADSQVEYGLSTSYGYETNKEAVLMTSHSVQVTGLSEGMRYHFRVKSVNAYGYLGISKNDSGLVTLRLDPPVFSDASIVQTSRLRLTWEAIPEAESYNVYRGTTPYFDPDKVDGSNRLGTRVVDEDSGLTAVQWTDQGDVVGNAETHYFYTVTSVSGIAEGRHLSRMGEFDYRLVVTDGTDFNEIGLPLSPWGITNAQELMDAIPGCNSVARWDAAGQGYEQYVPRQSGDELCSGSRLSLLRERYSRYDVHPVGRSGYAVVQPPRDSHDRFQRCPASFGQGAHHEGIRTDGRHSRMQRRGPMECRHAGV